MQLRPDHIVLDVNHSDVFMHFTFMSSFMPTVLNNTAYSRNTLSRTNDLGKTVSDTGVSQTVRSDLSGSADGWRREQRDMGSEPLLWLPVAAAS